MQRLLSFSLNLSFASSTSFPKTLRRVSQHTHLNPTQPNLTFFYLTDFGYYIYAILETRYSERKPIMVHKADSSRSATHKSGIDPQIFLAKLILYN